MIDQELRDSRLRKARWQIAWPSLAWINTVTLFWIIVEDSPAGILAPFLLILGVVMAGGTVWSLVVAILDRNDWLILYAGFALLPTSYILTGSLVMAIS